MFWRPFLAGLVFFGLQVPLCSAAAVALSSWVPEPGDTVTVDTVGNRLYVFKKDSADFLDEPVATGQLRTVRYIGRTYYAATPLKLWTMESSHIKSDRVTFGKTGLFLRLYDEGESTAYGIHSHRDITYMLNLEADDRYRSMGCILVSQELLDVLEREFEVNNEMLSVRTVAGPVEPVRISVKEPALGWLLGGR